MKNVAGCEATWSLRSDSPDRRRSLCHPADPVRDKMHVRPGKGFRLTGQSGRQAGAVGKRPGDVRRLSLNFVGGAQLQFRWRSIANGEMGNELTGK